jgi:hypothetical protein
VHDRELEKVKVSLREQKGLSVAVGLQILLHEGKKGRHTILPKGIVIPRPSCSPSVDGNGAKKS